jgi:hypothetical protein
MAQETINEQGILTKYKPDAEQRSATISEGVASIGDAAFSDCENLTSINLPDSNG